MSEIAEKVTVDYSFRIDKQFDFTRIPVDLNQPKMTQI